SSSTRPRRVRNNNKRYDIGIDRRFMLTVEDVRFFGLCYAGFDQTRQHVRASLNEDRFKAHYGPDPRTVVDVLHDLKEEFGSGLIYKDSMMTMNWLKLYDVEHVLAGRWKHDEDYIRVAVKKNTEMIQSLKPKVVVFSGWGEDEIHICTVDGLNTDTQEFRLTPSSKYFNHKSNGPGLAYEFAVALRRVSELITLLYS
ncbi:hypothetical protein ACHAWF_000792, partial [Thalassiosira exigua]